MIRNFLLVAIRQWGRNRLSTIINLVGLTISISVAILAFLFFNIYATQDSFQTRRDRIYMVESIIDPGNKPEHWGVCPTPMGNAMVRDLPEVENTVSFRNRQAAFRDERGVSNGMVTFAEPAFFDFFDFELVEGNEEGILNPLSIYLSDESAEYYFPDGGATGQTMDLMIGDNIPVQLTVAGVFEKIPVNSSIRFSFLVPYQNLETWYGYDPNNWDGWNTGTFIMLSEGADIEAVRSKLEPYREVQNEANPDWAVDEFYIDPWKEATYNAPFQRSTFLQAQHPAGVVVVGLIGIILLLLASFNFANNSLVLISRRFREIGIRKISGSTRSQMIVQFVGENLLFVAMALVLGLIVTQAFTLPFWNSLIPEAESNLASLGETRGLLFISLLLLATGIGTGLYPSIIVSRFNPVQIFRGTSNRVGYSFMVRLLTGIQIALTFGLLFFTVYLQINNEHQKTIDWGYGADDIVWMPVEEPEACALMVTELEQNPDVLEAYAVRDHLGYGWRLQAMVIDDVRRDVSGLSVVPGYMEMMKIRLISGHLFDDRGADYESTDAVINRKLADALQLENAIGTKFTLDNEPYNIIGVVETTLNNGLLSTRQPMVYTVNKPEQAKYVVARTVPGRDSKVGEAMQGIKANLLPNNARLVYYQDELYAEMFVGFRSVSTVLNFSSAMALMISFMGLFGLISSQLSNRERELAVRRVLGARFQQVLQLISWPFLRLFVISLGIAIVPSWLLTMFYVNGRYAEKAAMSPLIPILIGVAMLSLILLTLLTQITSVTNRNPSQVLRDE